MKPGDLVKRVRVDRKNWKKHPEEFGLYMGQRIFKNVMDPSQDYECAEVMWLHKNASNGDRVSTIQSNLIEVANESR